jgi:nitrous oxide reductase
LGVIAAAVAVAVAGFVIASSSEDRKSTKAAPVRKAPSGAALKTKLAQPITIVIRNGKPVGGIKKMTVPKGDPVRFRVTSDVADEVHVHGYDLMKDVAKGGTVEFNFPAKIDGEFEAELEHRGEQILALTVEP